MRRHMKRITPAVYAKAAAVSGMLVVGFMFYHG